MDKETAQQMYVAKMARFAAKQNELACLAIEYGIPEEAYVSTSRESYQDMNNACNSSMEALRALTAGAKISDLIKKATDGSN